MIVHYSCHVILHNNWSHFQTWIVESVHIIGSGYFLDLPFTYENRSRRSVWIRCVNNRKISRALRKSHISIHSLSTTASALITKSSAISWSFQVDISVCIFYSFPGIFTAGGRQKKLQRTYSDIRFLMEYFKRISKVHCMSESTVTVSLSGLFIISRANSGISKQDFTLTSQLLMQF